ncbi:MAG: hypothetical protein LBT94_06600 [Prevotellaceae bacterium]|jgi:hypothetical protein|nr:hypothetical protein [Prevotellaceae bacterium]
MPEDARKLTEQQAVQLIAAMEQHAAEAPVLELTPENWEAEFGKDGKVQTPIGEVKMGEHQQAKLTLRNRTDEFGMIKPTLANPDVVVEKYAPHKNSERDTKLLFIKTFMDGRGEKYTHFESITVKKDGLEVSISSHIAEKKAVAKELTLGTTAYFRSELNSNSSELYLAENQNKNNGLPNLVSTQEDNPSPKDKGTKIPETTKNNTKNPTR